MSARHQLFRGLNARLEITPHGQRLSGRTAARWRHPWEIDCTFVRTDAGGEWRATINPGFLNGRPSFIEMPAEWLRAQVASGESDARDFGINPLTGEPYFSEWVFDGEPPPTKDTAAPGPGGPVRLTHEPTPYLRLSAWRSPGMAGPPRATSDGEIVHARAEGYPAYFASIGVKPAAPGGKSDTAPEDPERTREIRAMDVVLTQPRPGSALEIETLNPLLDNFTHRLSVSYTTAYFTAQAGRAKVAAFSKFVPFGAIEVESPFLRLPMNGGDPQIDQIQLATVWMVSPPDAAPEDQPDETWEPFVQHLVFWNLAHAVRFTPPPKPVEPLRISTGLGLGLLDFLGNALLAPINSAMDEANVFLNQADMRGRFWST